MTLSQIAQRFGKLVADNSPVILTAIGVTGTLSTAYLTAKASFKAARVIQHEKDIRIEHDMTVQYLDDRFGPLTKKEQVELCWKLYIPPAVTVLMTTAAIISANRVSSRRASALALAYTISERAFDEYKQKVVEKFGEKKEMAIRDEISQDRVTRTSENREVIVTGNGSVICQDAFSGRFFLSDMETIRTAENDINHRLIHDGYASLSDLYELLGLSLTSVSDEVGWNSDKLLDIHVSSTIAADKKPCLVLNFTVLPVRNYNRYN